MTTFAISADIRDASEKTSHIRASKKVPGVVYGKTQDPISFTVDSSDFLRLYRKAGESNIIDLKVGKLDLEVLVHQTQKHPVTGEFTHVDFYAITRGEKLSTKITINFIGDAPAVKEGAIIQEIVKEIEVQCLPRNLVDHFDADLSLLKEEGDTVRFEDLGVDAEKFDHQYEADMTIATATMPRSAVEEEAEVSAEWEETEAESEEKAAE